MPQPDIHFEPEGSGLPRRYRRIQIIREALQRLLETPVDESGKRVVLRMENQYRNAVKTAASDLKVFVKCEQWDSKWMKVYIVEPGEVCGSGRPPGTRVGKRS